MATLFLVIIYLAFISLGLPDSLLGVAWPVMQVEYSTHFAAAGFVSMIISGGTIVSSLFSGIVIKRLGTGNVTFISCLMTAGALFGFSLSPSFVWLLVLAVPLGLGAGAVDSALNNYVALHYKAHHMSWLHCFWGIGATLGPIIMSAYIIRQSSWRSGYLTISILQFVLVILFFMTLPLWNKQEKEIKNQSAASDQNVTLSELGIDTNKLSGLKILNIRGVKLALTTFFFYCSVELSIGLWGSSYLVNVRGIPAATAARWVSIYYGGITLGRFISGFITMKLSNTSLIRTGQMIILAGVSLLLLPLSNIFVLIGFMMIGLGCAPIFPCMLHETPKRFGKEYSSIIMGYQMGFAYIGSTLMPPLLGFIASISSIGILPICVLLYSIFMLIASEKINCFMKTKHKGLPL